MSEEKKDLTAQAPSQELTAKKSEKVQKKDKKPGLFARMGKWFRELRIEAKKVVWPTGKSVWKNTLVVIAVLLRYRRESARPARRPDRPAGLIPGG